MGYDHARLPQSLDAETLRYTGPALCYLLRQHFWHAWWDQQLEEVTQILEAYGAAEEELGHQIQETEADRFTTGYQTIESVDLPDSSPEDAGPTAQEAPAAATSAPPVSKPLLTGALDSVPSPVTNIAEATTFPPLNTPLQEDITTEQPAHDELTSEQTTAPTDLTPEQDPSEPLQTKELTVTHEPDAAVTEPPSVPTPPSDPTPPEPSILDIFDDA